MKFAIVAVAYNRPNSLRRLLDSLSKANYDDFYVDLIISIDRSDNNLTENIASDFFWGFGNKIIRTYPERLGLRKHIIQCGDFLSDYDALAVFEDDIIASPLFFKFMRSSAEFYKEDNSIAGISLYSPRTSEYNSRPFIPMKGNCDIYYMQYAQSWGQVWLKEQWFSFKEWYSANNDIDITAPNIPANVSNWPDSSWLKYHIKYCVENNKYFVYPYFSLSTNFTDIGHHNDKSSSNYQVPIVYGNDSYFKFDRISIDDAVIYDVFFERENIGKFLGISDDSITVDLYGKKDLQHCKRYLLTVNIHDYKIVKKFALSLRPHEMNVIFGVNGESIFLYDTTIHVHNSNKEDIEILLWHYDLKAVGYKLISKILYSKIKTEASPKKILFRLWSKIIFLSRCKFKLKK
jgi:hypothetical protein